MSYEAFFFDFDGVLADSIEVKTRAFAKLFESHGNEVVQQVVDYHRRHGGITRTEKFDYYYREILGKALSENDMADLCRRFSALVVDEVVAAPEIEGAEAFLKKWSPKLSCFVISAVPEEEIREIVRRRHMAGYFKEVLGAPADKKENLGKLLQTYSLTPSACYFFGDAESDYGAAQAWGVPFIGIVPDAEAPLVRFQPDVNWTRNFLNIEKKLT
jgi:phosphoglycolate phosphatase-like HAD superfamily hydrolase